MLIVFLLLAFIRTLHGVPISLPTEVSGSFISLNIRDTQEQFGTRAVNDIILSCFATILACTWSAVHPNIPSPTDCWWTGFKRRVVIMVYALLAPEAITAWALRQRMAAKAIADDYNAKMAAQGKKLHTDDPSSIVGIIQRLFRDFPLPPELEKGEVPRWTLTHGFFLQMGGFILCKNGRPVQSLTSGTWNAPKTLLDWNINNGVVDPPRITEEEIKDRSKSDAISKTFVILQTTWFISQCIARWLQHLPVTELEVVTLGFAMLNGITYWLWWNKPQNVGQPVHLEAKMKMWQNQSGDHPMSRKQYKDHLKSQRQEALHLSRQQSLRQASTNPAQDYKNGHEPSRNPYQYFEPAPMPVTQMLNLQYTAWQQSLRQAPANPAQNHKNIQPATQMVWPPIPHQHIRPVAAPIPATQTPNFQNIGPAEHITKHRSKFHLLFVPFIFIGPLLYPLAKLVDLYAASVPTGALRVPMLYSGGADSATILRATSVIGVLFGLVHLVTSWFLEFPSTLNLRLWRVAAVVITAQPMFILFYQLTRRSTSQRIRDTFKALMIGGLPVYIAARIVLLTLSLLSLRSLPSGAFQTIKWTVFIPHI